jgi:lipopolysaccharide biosynthesis regulator YciM
MFWLVVGLLALAAAVALILAERFRRKRDQARAYLEGFRHMLSDDHDAAIEALSDAARLGSAEGVGTYLALGALFRRTGDLDRAIRLHRNMLMRPGLDPTRRMEVERELAHDFRSGGMLDDAAEAFRSLAARGDRLAAEGLRDALIDQGDLAGAVEAQRSLANGEEDPVLSRLLACLAREQLATDAARARRLAAEAAAAGPRVPEALLALAEAEAVAGEGAAAADALRRALDADPGAAVLAWPALSALQRSHGALAGALVAERLERHPADAALHLLDARLGAAAGDGPRFVEALRRALELDGSGEVTLAIRDLLREPDAGAADGIGERHALLLAALARPVKPLRCRHCLTESLSRTWRCPSCGAFDAYGRHGAFRPAS